MPMQVREAGSQPTFVGPRTVTVRALTYGPADTYGTSWAPGVFADSLSSGDVIPACWGHDGRQVVGSVVGSTERRDGLDLEIRLADPHDVPAARMVASLLRDGHISGVSVGFGDGVTEPDPTQRGVVRFRKAKLREVSFVTAASVPGAKVLAMRSALHAATYQPTTDELIASAADVFAHIDAVSVGIDAREASRQEWAKNVVKRATSGLTADRRDRGQDVSLEEIRAARSILGGDTVIARKTAEAAPPELIPQFEPPEMLEWKRIHFTASEVPGMFRTPVPVIPCLDEGATPEQIQAYNAATGMDGSTFTLTPPPHKIPRDLFEAAMSNPAAYPGFDPNGNGMEIR